MRHIYHADFLDILGWSLFDSLWQMGFLWLLHSLVTANGRRFSATIRYFLAVAITGVGTIWFLSGFLWRYLYAPTGPSFTAELLALFGTTAAVPFQIPSLIPLAYLAVLLVLTGRLLYQYHSTRQIQTSGLAAAPEQLQVCLAALQRKMALLREISLRLSEKVVTPVTIGFIRPAILLPMAVITQLSPSQLEALIAHELFHIKRHDYLLNLGLAVAGQVFFFNPFARLLIDAARKEREAGCDDGVLQLGYAAGDYARALYTLGKNQSVPANRLVMAAAGKGGKPLLQRIRRMLRQPVEPVAYGRPLLILVVIILLTGNVQRQPLPSVLPTPAALPKTAQSVGLPKTAQSVGLPKTAQSAVRTVPAEVEDPAVAIRPTAPQANAPLARRQDQAPLVSAPTDTSKQTDVDRAPAIISDQEDSPAPTAHYASEVSAPREFSMPEKKTVLPDLAPVGRTLPYVPRSTFYYPQHPPAPATADSTGPRSIRL